MAQIDVNESLKSAAQHFNNGDMEKADYICRRILQNEARNTDALQLLALVSVRRNKLQDSIALLKEACEYCPDNPEYLINLGNVSKISGDRLGARKYYEQAIKADEKSIIAFYNLGLLLAEQGEFAEAAQTYRRALAIDNNVAELHYSLASVLKSHGKMEEAIESCREALSIRPMFFEAQMQLGNLFYEESKLADALLAYEKALQIDPENPIAFNGIGVCQTALGNYFFAAEALAKAVSLEPNIPDLHNNLAVAYMMLGEYAKAIMSLDQAVRLHPAYPEAWRNYGNVLASQKRYVEAIHFYEKALSLAPDFYEARLELGIAFKEFGEKEKAKVAFQQAQQLQPKALAPKCGILGASLPNFYWAEEEIIESRQKYEDDFAQLEKYLATQPFDLNEAEDALSLVQPFYLAYQSENNLALYKQYGQLLQTIIAGKYPQWSQGRQKHFIKPGERIKLGIVSHNFSNHADWKMITSGIVNNIRHDQFELFGYSTGGVVDNITKEIKDKFEHYYYGLSFTRLCEQIDKDELDILFFPELGMDPVSMKVACLRFAPVQCCAWGRTETSGLATIDYFISAEAMEPANAQAHYVEKLALLPGLGFYYEPSILSPRKENIDSLGLRGDAIKFLCAQSLVKYLPQYDSIFIEIAKRVPNAQFLFISRPDGLAEKFLERLNRAFAKEGLQSDKYISMLPFLSLNQFKSICDSADIFLDSIGFSGCVTALDAIEQSLPIVTLRGEFMRGRQCAAMLEVMGLQELVASNVDNYIEKAEKLASESEYRTVIRQKIVNGKAKLYRDKSVIESLEKMFQAWLK